jgi:Fe2+ or Zn2+ uptake regulation protein
MTIIPDKSPVARRRDGASAALRGVGLRLTGPRRLVLEVVRGSDAHPTAEAVHQMVRCRLPRVSLGTVYRNLRLLVAQGLVKELPGPHTRFDCNLTSITTSPVWPAGASPMWPGRSPSPTRAPW